MSIKVTLLRRPHQTYCLTVGSQTYRFRGEETVEVSREIAEACASVKDDERPLFEVIGLEGDPDADVAEVLGIQLEWLEWPSSPQ